MNERLIQVVLLGIVIESAPLATEAGNTNNVPDSADPRSGLTLQVTNGFVFVNGRYLETPYTVDREALSVRINGTLIESYDKAVADEPNLPADGSEPPVPPEITRTSTLQDQALRDYIFNMAAFAEKRHGSGEQRARAVENALRRLPCIQNIERDPQDPESATVTFTNGKKQSMRLTLFPRKPVITKSTAPQYVDRICRNYAERLGKGDCFVFSETGKMSFGIGRARDVLPKLLDILASTESPELKADKIKSLGLGLASESQLREVATNTVSPQLRLRVEALTKEKTEK